MPQYRFLVAGAGYTGRRVLAALPAGSAIGTRRRRGDGDAPMLVADFDRELPPLPGAGVILYTVPPPRPGRDDPRLARFLAAVAEPPRRLVYFSTSGVYGDHGGARVSEATPPRPATDRARRRLAAETLATDWCRERGVECTILRVPGIYGPGRLGLARRRAGAPVLCEADAGPGNRIHVDDLVACALAAADPARPAGLYNLGDGNPASASWFAGEVARAAGLPPPPQVTLAEARQSFGAARLSFLEESRQVDVTRMRDVLGVVPHYADPREGIRASLAADPERP